MSLNFGHFLQKFIRNIFSNLVRRHVLFVLINFQRASRRYLFVVNFLLIAVIKIILLVGELVNARQLHVVDLGKPHVTDVELALHSDTTFLDALGT